MRWHELQRQAQFHWKDLPQASSNPQCALHRNARGARTADCCRWHSFRRAGEVVYLDHADHNVRFLGRQQTEIPCEEQHQAAIPHVLRLVTDKADQQGQNVPPLYQPRCPRSTTVHAFGGVEKWRTVLASSIPISAKSCGQLSTPNSGVAATRAHFMKHSAMEDPAWLDGGLC